MGLSTSVERPKLFPADRLVRQVAMTVYEFDRDSAPDSDYVSGALDLLVAGNRGRLLDSRRTPVQVTAVHPDTGAFQIEILAFEDRGARWELGLEEITHFQFERDAARAAPRQIRELDAAQQRFGVEISIDPDPAAFDRTAEAIATERARVRRALALDSVSAVDLAIQVQMREGHPAITTAVEELLEARGLAEVDEAFATAFVSNPRSGELVKGHSVVLAELGLCRYQGPVVRDPQRAFDTWPKARRAEHIVLRLALVRELYSLLRTHAITLFRAAAHEGPVPSSPPRSFVSATFSREVAEEHFAGGPRTTAAVMWRQETPADRLFMTFLETAALTRQFKEAEAILIAGSETGALF
jgi:hypothetical protein